jgi:hypothetical protein
MGNANTAAKYSRLPVGTVVTGWKSGRQWRGTVSVSGRIVGKVWL